MPSLKEILTSVKNLLRRGLAPERAYVPVPVRVDRRRR